MFFHQQLWADFQHGKTIHQNQFGNEEPKIVHVLFQQDWHSPKIISTIVWKELPLTNLTWPFHGLYPAQLSPF